MTTHAHDQPQSQTHTVGTLERGARWLAAAALGIVTLLALLFAINSLWQTYLFTNTPIDEMFYADVARIAAHGGVPFREVWDIKPPVNTYILAPFVWAFGNTVFAVKIATLTLSAAFVVVVAAVTGALARSWAAVIGAAVVALVYGAWMAYADGWGPVQVMLVIAAAAMLAAIAGRGRPAWMLVSGVLLACAFHTKQVAAPEGFAAVVFAAMFAPAGARWRAALLVIVGGLLGLVAFALLWWWQGVLLSVWQNAFVNSFLYAFEPGGNNWHFNADFVNNFRAFFVGQSLPLLLPLLVMSIPALWVLLRDPKTRPVTLAVVFWAVMAVLGAMIGRSMRRTYFLQVLPALIVLNALAVPIFLRLRGGWRLVLVGLLAVALYQNGIIRDPGRQWQRMTSPTHRTPDSSPLLAQWQPTVDALREHTAPGECIWTWDTVGIVRYLADRDPCTPDPAAHVMMVRESFEFERLRAEHMNELFTDKPTRHTRYGTWGYFRELDRFADRYLGEQLFAGVDAYGTIDLFAVDMSPFREHYANFGGMFEMIGYDLYTPETVCAGDPIETSMTWRLLTTPIQPHNLFLHLLTEDQTVRVAGVDAQPHSDLLTAEWDYPGMLYLGDTLRLDVPADTAPGTYLLVTGFYDVQAFERVPVTDAAGAALPGDYVLLTSITVTACD